MASEALLLLQGSYLSGAGAGGGLVGWGGGLVVGRGLVPVERGRGRDSGPSGVGGVRSQMG